MSARASTGPANIGTFFCMHLHVTNWFSIQNVLVLRELKTENFADEK